MNQMINGAKVAVYLRCSTDQQKNSVEDQRAYIQPIVESNRLSVIREFTDEGESGATIDGRPEIKKMLASAEKHAFEILLVYDVSRFSRGGAGEFWTLVQRLKKLEVRVYSCTHRRFVTENDAVLFSSEASFARQSNIQHSRDITRTMISNVRDRKMDPGRVAPFGYDRVYLDSTGKEIEILRTMPDGTKQVLDPVTQQCRQIIPKGESRRKLASLFVKLVPSESSRVETLKLIFKLAPSMGYKEIANHLNNLRRPSPRGGLWSFTSIRDILLNPAYTGRIVFNRIQKSRYHGIRDGNIVAHDDLHEGKLNRNVNDKKDWIIIDNAHDALVTDKQFEAAQSAMKKRAHVSATRSPNHVYLLSGLMRCSKCGESMQGHSKRASKAKGHKRYFYYVCSTARKHGKDQCSVVSVPAEEIEHFAIDSVRSLLTSPEALHMLESGIREHLACAQQGLDERPRLEKELAALKVKRKRLFDRLLNENSQDFFRDEIDVLHKEIQNMEARLGDADSKMTKKDIDKIIAQAKTYYMETFLTLQGSEHKAIREALRALGVSLEFDPIAKEGRLWYDHFMRAAG
jgi:site-specific DNA recombinase